jgi:hypothetical protein
LFAAFLLPTAVEPTEEIGDAQDVGVLEPAEPQQILVATDNDCETSRHIQARDGFPLRVNPSPANCQKAPLNKTSEWNPDVT